MSFKSKIREILRVKDEENGDVIIANIFFILTQLEILENLKR